MKKLLTGLVVGLALLVAAPAAAQETPRSLVATYDSLADAILGLKDAEHDLVMSVLDAHYAAAAAHVHAGEYADAAAQMAMFANEGDNAVAGIRKRLVDGGHHHHHHADDADEDEYDEGFVIVTKVAKATILEMSGQMRQAADEAAAVGVWDSFAEVAASLMEESAQ